ncbi:MAG: lmo0937 family membrane protein [Myxococcota bacterium]
MLWAIAVILILLWLLALSTSVSLGGFIHLLLVVGLVMLAVRFIKRPRHKDSGPTSG